MKTTQLLVLLSFAGVLQLSGCASSPEAPMNTDKVVVSQAGDLKLSCTDIEPQLESIETEVKEMLVEKQKRANKTFTMTTVIDMTLALLSGSASANNRVDRSTLEDFSQPELERINSLADRHHHLMVIAKDKECDFVPKVEARIAQYKKAKTSLTPALDEQDYRKRVRQN